MATSTGASNKSAKKVTKSSAAFASTKADLIPSGKNSSKFTPSSEAKMDLQLLDAADGLFKLFTDAVKDIYWAEKQLVKSLPKMAKAAASSALADAITDHLVQTETHVERLEQVFELLDKKPQAKKCDAMEGLAKEGEGIIESTDQGTPARDLGIIMASQKVEHYEIATYTGLIKLAGKLNLPEVANILSATLTEEQEADLILAEIADTSIPVDEA